MKKIQSEKMKFENVLWINENNSLNIDVEIYLNGWITFKKNRNDKISYAINAIELNSINEMTISTYKNNFRLDITKKKELKFIKKLLKNFFEKWKVNLE